MRKTIVSIAFGWLVLAPVCGSAAEVTTKTAHCKEGEARYVLFAPAQPEAMPAILLLHGAGDRPEPMVEAWKKLAKKEKFVLIAPELPRDPKFEDVAPKIFRCVVEDAKQIVKLEAQRVYLFGNSMGGYLAYDGAMLESNYFAAAAIHAMRIAEEYTWIVSRAERKTPVAIYIGDRDQFIPLEGVRKTRDLLLKEKFSVHYVELKNHDHNYYALADQINGDAWKFLKEVQLPAH